MQFWYGLAQLIGVHTILGLSAYVVLQTGQVTLAQAGFFSIGAYVSAMLTAVAGWHLVPALFVGGATAATIAIIVGFPALRVKGLMFVVATIAFGEAVRLFWFNFTSQVQEVIVGVDPQGGLGFNQIRFFPANGWTDLDRAIFIWAVMAILMAGVWWLDRSRAGAVLRAVGEDDLAAQSVGVNLTAVKVTAFALGGFIAGVGGTLYAHYTTHIGFNNFGIVLAIFAIAYPIVGGLHNVFGTLAAVIFIQGFLVEGLRFLGDWRNLLFGVLIIVAMNVSPRGFVSVYRGLSLYWRRRVYGGAIFTVVLILSGEAAGDAVVALVDGLLGRSGLQYNHLAWIVFLVAMAAWSWRGGIELTRMIPAGRQRLSGMLREALGQTAARRPRRTA
ncbi:MAG TPA: branched-chain amino acid ABC transporter permease [Alphaproteobacteria bacterium]|nr:branched-chain amino acid ABC transporter permease [Alphaproteobacteria bacterium]